MDDSLLEREFSDEVLILQCLKDGIIILKAMD